MFWGTGHKTADNEEWAGSADVKSDEWDKEYEIPLMKLKKRLEAYKVEKELPLNRRLWSTTKQKDDETTKESSKEMKIEETLQGWKRHRMMRGETFYLVCIYLYDLYNNRKNRDWSHED